MSNDIVVYILCIVLCVVLCVCIEIKYRILLRNLPIPTNLTIFLPNLKTCSSIQNVEKQLFNEGVVSGVGKIDPLLCDKVKQFANNWDKKADYTMYGDINTRDSRYDLFMPLEGPILQVVKRLLSYWKKMNMSLYNTNARIIEVACLVSKPGCTGQRIHVDTSDRIGHRHVISYGVFLQDVNSWLSPLVVKPDKDDTYWCSVVGKKGDVYAWSSKVEHGGGANRTNRSRYLFYITIMYPPVKYVEVGGYSLLPKYGGGIVVGDIV